MKGGGGAGEAGGGPLRPKGVHMTLRYRNMQQR